MNREIEIEVEIGTLTFDCNIITENDTFTHEFGTEYSKSYLSLETYKLVDNGTDLSPFEVELWVYANDEEIYKMLNKEIDEN
jgi:hypothetical protein